VTSLGVCKLDPVETSAQMARKKRRKKERRTLWVSLTYADYQSI